MLEAKCREDAKHCERMAAIVLTKAQRDSYLELANLWRKLADDAGKHRLRVEAWTLRTARPTSAATSNGAGLGDAAERMAGAD
jgi:hypothetical protein